jgi:hypothetical protein
MTPRDLALDVAASHLGTFYSWGGDDPSAFDCSGLIVEVLKSVGILPREGDWNAESLFRQRFLTKPRHTASGELRPGMLVFWAGASGRMRHVEMVYAITDRPITIGASGGGSKTKSREDAIRDNAFVKLRPVNVNWVAAVDPF